MQRCLSCRTNIESGAEGFLPSSCGNCDVCLENCPVPTQERKRGAVGDLPYNTAAVPGNGLSIIISADDSFSRPDELVSVSLNEASSFDRTSVAQQCVDVSTPGNAVQPGLLQPFTVREDACRNYSGLGNRFHDFTDDEHDGEVDEPDADAEKSGLASAENNAKGSMAGKKSASRCAEHDPPPPSKKAKCVQASVSLPTQKKTKSKATCPCCSEERVVDGEYHFGRAGVSLAVCANPEFLSKFDDSGVGLGAAEGTTFFVCSGCWKATRKALEKVRRDYPLASGFEVKKRNKPNLPRPIAGSFNCGNKTLLSFLNGVEDGTCTLDLTILEMAFSAGDLAVASRRKHAKANEEGGVCKITKAYRGRDNATELYDVTYVVGSRKETGLTVDVLSKLLEPEHRRMRALAAESQNVERIMDRLSGELDRARARIGILEAEASRQRERYRTLGMERKEAVREAKRLESELRGVLVLREAENERTHRSILELVEEAVAAATADAAAAIKSRILEAKELQEKTRREHSARVKELEHQLRSAHVNQQRIEGSAAEMLKETIDV